MSSAAVEAGPSALARASRATAALALAAIFSVAAASSLRLAFIAWQKTPETRSELVARVRALPTAANYRQALARDDLARGRFERARRRLRMAIRHAPFAAGLWHDLGDANLRSGRTAEAMAAVDRAVQLAPTDAGGCYHAALVHLQVGDGQGAGDALRCVLNLAPARTAEILELTRAVYADDALVIRTILPAGVEPLRRYLAWTYERKLVDAATAGWTALQLLGSTPADRLRHIEFLLRVGDIRAAEELWTAAYGPRAPGVVFDGDFETDPVGTGFGWLVGTLKGARVTIGVGRAAARGLRGLAIEFSGGNLDFSHVRQIVPVVGARRYRLSALAQAEGITSLTGPRFWVGAGAACTPFSVEGPEWRGSTGWTPVAVEFDTPADCQSIVIMVRRPPSARLDRDLRGRLNLDDVKLSDLGAPA